MELLILYPYDMAAKRLMAVKGRDRTSAELRLDAFFGGREWADELRQSQLKDETDGERRVRFVDYYVRKLQGLGYKYVLAHGPLYNRHRPLYHLIFASDDEVGERIMRSVMDSGKARWIEGEMGYQPVQRPLL